MNSVIARIRKNGLESGSATLAITCVLAAQFFFTTQDMAIKWLSGDYALHQIILTRAAVGILFVLAFFVPLEGGYSGLRTRKLGLHLLRGFGIVIANLCFFTGLITLPLGEATAIFFVAPLLITALSVLLLGESVGASRWAAVVSGLVGVLIVLRPREDVFSPA